MGFIRFLILLLSNPLLYPGWWLLFSWLLWLVLKWRNWNRPTVSMMLIYSISVAIFYTTSLQDFRACMRIELCYPVFSVPQFIAAVSFWFIVLYASVALTLHRRSILASLMRNWWIAFPMIAFAAWHLFVETIRLVRFLEFSNLISSDILSDILSDIFFYPVMLLLLAWLLWLMLPIFRLPTPTFMTVFVFSVAVAKAATRIWIYDDAIFSFPLFLLEVTIWFIILYLLMKLALQIERQVPV